MKLSHINLLNLTTEELEADMQKRMAESKGAPVLYPYETVEALLSALRSLEGLAKANRRKFKSLIAQLPAANKATRDKIVLALEGAVTDVNTAIGPADVFEEEW